MEHDMLIVLGAMTIFGSWLDIFNISLFFRKVVLCSLMCFALYAGCSNFPISADFANYDVLYFSRAPNQFIFSDFEAGILDYGFWLLWHEIKILGGDIYTAYFITCTVSLLFYYVSISRYTSYILTAWSFIYIRLFCSSNIVQIRQGLAMAIILFALQYIEKKCFLKFLLVVVIAASFHKTVLVVVFLYPLALIRWNKFRFICAVMIMTLLGNIGISNIIFGGAAITGIGAEKMYSYADSIYFSESAISAILVQGLSIILCAYYLIKIRSEKYTNLFVSMLAGGYFFLMLSKDVFIMSRMTSIFMLCMNFIPMYLFCICRSISHKIFVMMSISLLLSFLLIKNVVIN